MAVADGAVLRIVASLLFPDSVIAQNVFYLVFADTGTSADEDDVITDIVTWVEEMYEQVEGSISLDVLTDELKVYNYDAIDDDWDEVGASTFSHTFLSSTDMLPHGVAAVVHARTVDPDVMATKYIGGFHEAMTADSDIVASGLTDLADFNDSWVTAFVGAVTGADFAPGVWSTKQSVFKLFNGSHVVNGLIGYQRRRKPGVGI